MKGRKTAAIPGIILAAISIEDDSEFGLAVKDYLVRCGEIRGKHELIAKAITRLIDVYEDDYDFGNAVRALLVDKKLILLRDGKYEACKSQVYRN